MRRITMALAIGVLAIAAGACTSGSSAADLSLDEVLAKIVDAGIDCDGEVTPSETEEGEIDFGVTIVEEFDCDVGDLTLEGSHFASTSDARVALTFMESFGCGLADDDLVYVGEGSWFVTAGDASGSSESKLTKRIAEAIGTKVHTIECSGDSFDADDTEDADDAASTTTLLDSDDLVAADEAARASAEPVELDEFADLGDGLFVKISSIEVVDDDGTPVFSLEVRAENRGSEERSMSFIGVACAGSEELGDWSWNSTFDPYETVRAGSFTEGRLNLYAPTANITNETFTDCATPAVVRIEDWEGEFDLAIPDDLVAEFNDLLDN